MTQAETTSTTRGPLAVTVRKATAADSARVADVMARAFDDDPFANWMAAQDDKRPERIRHLMATSFDKLTLPHGEVYTTDAYQGGALWTPPGKWKLGMLQQILLLPSMVKTTSWRRIPAVMGGISAVEKKHPSAPHYYLMALGVDPDLQGRSVGTQLMRPVLEKCDAEHMPAYLESSKERNVPLYERNGFKVTEEMIIPNGGPKIWLMWRDAR